MNLEGYTSSMPATTPGTAHRTRRIFPALTALLLLAIFPAAPTAGDGDQEGHHPHRSPYAGEPDSGIAGLTADEIAQLEEGAGMGMARPAELNGYPGPKHVLELAEELELTAEQHSAVAESHRRMAAEARRIGALIIDKERHLDRLFEHHHIDEGLLQEISAAIADLYGELRFAHLRAHLETAAILIPEQVAAYDRLRGYTLQRSGPAHP